MSDAENTLAGTKECNMRQLIFLQLNTLTKQIGVN